MGYKTGIQWTERSWNPWRGCTKISPGCKNCYMFTEQNRYGQDPSVVIRTKTWNDPIRWQKEAAASGRFDRVFTCSWSDWFHKDADDWRDEAWAVVRRCPNLIFQILTKRPERICEHLPRDWGNGYPNVWLGISAEDQVNFDKRHPFLAYIPVHKVRFISAEPLLGPINFRGMAGIRWVIFGGESGPGARPCRLEWIQDGVAQCFSAGAAPFVKQLGSRPTWNHIVPGCSVRESIEPWKVTGKGGNQDEWPNDLCVRKFPI